MIKTIGLFTRKPGLSRQEFSRRWREHGLQLVELLPAMKGYVQNHIAEEADAPFDALGEFWFESMEECRRLLAPEQWSGGRALREAEERFMDSTKTVWFSVDEVVHKEPPRQGAAIKAVSFEPRQPAVTREEYSRHWKEVGLELVKLLPTMKGYVQNHLLPEEDAWFDGIAELWFHTMEELQAFQETLASEKAATLMKEVEAFVDLSKIVPVLVEEVVLKR